MPREFHTWLLPPPAHKPNGKPYASRWKMTAADAAAAGAIAPVPGTMELRPDGPAGDASGLSGPCPWEAPLPRG